MSLDQAWGKRVLEKDDGLKAAQNCLVLEEEKNLLIKLDLS